MPKRDYNDANWWKNELSQSRQYMRDTHYPWWRKNANIYMRGFDSLEFAVPVNFVYPVIENRIGQLYGRPPAIEVNLKQKVYGAFTDDQAYAEILRIKRHASILDWNLREIMNLGSINKRVLRTSLLMGTGWWQEGFTTDKGRGVAATDSDIRKRKGHIFLDAPSNYRVLFDLFADQYENLRWISLEVIMLTEEAREKFKNNKISGLSNQSDDYEFSGPPMIQTPKEGAATEDGEFSSVHYVYFKDPDSKRNPLYMWTVVSEGADGFLSKPEELPWQSDHFPLTPGTIAHHPNGGVIGLNILESVYPLQREVSRLTSQWTDITSRLIPKIGVLPNAFQGDPEVERAKLESSNPGLIIALNSPNSVFPINMEGNVPQIGPLIEYVSNGIEMVTASLRPRTLDPQTATAVSAIQKSIETRAADAEQNFSEDYARTIRNLMQIVRDVGDNTQGEVRQTNVYGDSEVMDATTDDILDEDTYSVKIVPAVTIPQETRVTTLMQIFTAVAPTLGPKATARFLKILMERSGEAEEDISIIMSDIEGQARRMEAMKKAEAEAQEVGPRILETLPQILQAFKAPPDIIPEIVKAVQGIIQQTRLPDGESEIPMEGPKGSGDLMREGAMSGPTATGANRT